MEWQFSAEQINDGELTFSLTEFTNKLFQMVCDDLRSELGDDMPPVNMSDPIDDYCVQYYVCFYNYMLCLSTDRSRRTFLSHTKKLDIRQTIRARFMDKKFLAELEQTQTETVNMFKAVLKRFVSDLIESGISTTRLPQMIYMQQLNSFSSIIPSVIRNETARKMLIRIEFHDSLLGSLRKIFRIPTGV